MDREQIVVSGEQALVGLPGRVDSKFGKYFQCSGQMCLLEKGRAHLGLSAIWVLHWNFERSCKGFFKSLTLLLNIFMKLNLAS